MRSGDTSILQSNRRGSQKREFDLLHPGLTPDELAPWIDTQRAKRSGLPPEAVAAETARDWRAKLAAWRLGTSDIEQFRAATALRVITPGTTAGEPLHVLSALERPSALWDTDVEAARESLGRYRCFCVSSDGIRIRCGAETT